MTEPKQEYQTERKEPPNLRTVKCCAVCKYQMSWRLDSAECGKHTSVMIFAHYCCDDYEPDN